MLVARERRQKQIEANVPGSPPPLSCTWTSVRGHRFLTKAASQWLCPFLLIIPGLLIPVPCRSERIWLDRSSLCGQEAGHMLNFDCWVPFFGLGRENRASCIWHFITRSVTILCSADKLSHANHTRFLGDWRHITWPWENVGRRRRQRWMAIDSTWASYVPAPRKSLIRNLRIAQKRAPCEMSSNLVVYSTL